MLMRRRPHRLGSGRAFRAAVVWRRPLHRRLLVWRRRGLWRRHRTRRELTVALTAVAAIRLITVRRRRCLVDGGRHGLWRGAALLASELRLLMAVDIGLQLMDRLAGELWHLPGCGLWLRAGRPHHTVFRLHGSVEAAADPLP